MKEKLRFKSEYGAATIVEATIVFPIMIFIVIILIYLGNVYYQMARIEAVAARTATYASGLYADPLLENMGNGGSVPSSFHNIKPYRYLFGNSSAAGAAETYLDDELAKIRHGMFRGMTPEFTHTECRVKNYVFYQTVTVEIEYEIQIPVYFFGEEATLVHGTTATRTCVTDGAEFIRNIKMAGDYFESLAPQEWQDKLNDMTSNISGWFKKSE